MDSTFLKWAGGKNWFVRHQLQRIPNQYNRYIDPFLGGGALLFYLEPPDAIVSDINQELITTYIAIQNEWQAVQRNLRVHARHHSNEYYYHVRDMRPRTDATIAARMIYLNRT